MKAVIYMIICLSFCSELIHCSCLSYGHSCWGAHGKKRSDRIETDDSQYLDDRWALFRVVQNENDKPYGRDHIARAQVDDSLDYNDKRIPSNFLNALRKRNIPLIILNTNDDAGFPQETKKTMETSAARKRRSYTRTDTPAMRATTGAIKTTTNKLNDSMSFERKHFTS